MRTMKLKLALGLFTAASALLLSDVANAYHTMPKYRWYARLGAGYTLPDNVTLTDPGKNGGAPFRYSRVKINGGFVGDAALGFHFFRMIRGEVMVGYLYRKLNDNAVPTTSGPGTGTLGNQVLSSTVSSKVQSFVGMVNGYVDLLEWHHFIPYVGAGLGFSANKLDNVVTNGQPAALLGQFTYQSRTETNLAWQLTAGTALRLTEEWTADLYYRYMNLGKIKSSTQNNLNYAYSGALSGNYNSHMVVLGVRYSW